MARVFRFDHCADSDDENGDDGGHESPSLRQEDFSTHKFGSLGLIHVQDNRSFQSGYESPAMIGQQVIDQAARGESVADDLRHKHDTLRSYFSGPGSLLDDQENERDETGERMDRVNNYGSQSYFEKSHPSISATRERDRDFVTPSP